MCFSGSFPGKVPLSLRPVRLSGGMMFTIMGRGSPISPDTPGTASHLPAPHLRRDEIENNTNFMYGQRRERQSCATDEYQTQFHLGRAGCQSQGISQFVSLSFIFPLLCSWTVSSTLGVSLIHANTFLYQHTHKQKAWIDSSACADSLDEACTHGNILRGMMWKVFLLSLCIQTLVKNVCWHLFTCPYIQDVRLKLQAADARCCFYVHPSRDTETDDLTMTVNGRCTNGTYWEFGCT